MTMNLLTITNEVLKIKNVSIKCVRILDIVPYSLIPLMEQSGAKTNIMIRIGTWVIHIKSEHACIRRIKK